MGSERRASVSSIRSVDSNSVSQVGAKTSAENAFYEECKTTYLSMFKSTNERILSKQQLYTLLTRAARSPSKVWLSFLMVFQVWVYGSLLFCDLFCLCP